MQVGTLSDSYVPTTIVTDSYRLRRQLQELNMNISTLALGVNHVPQNRQIRVHFPGVWGGLNHNLSFHSTFHTHFALFSPYPCPRGAKLPQCYEKVWTCSQCGISLARKCEGSRNRASPGTLACSLTHHLHSLENAITVGRLLAYFIYCHEGLRGNW